MWCDLHLHSHHSDGEFAPGRVVDMLADAGVGLIALTDHDTTAGAAEAHARAAARGIKAVAGIEMTAFADGRVVHVLGYGMRAGAGEVERRNRVALDVWSDNCRRWVSAMASGGFDVTEGDVLAEGFVRLPVLVERLCARGVDDGDAGRCYARFKTFFSELPAEAYSALPSPAQAARSIREAGGIAVLAHPDRVGDEGVVGTMLGDFDGIEADYARYGPDERASLRELAERSGKLYTGGSDYHGYFNGDYANPRFEAPREFLVRLGLT